LGPHASVKFLGRLEADALAALYAAGDLFVWPALKEAYGFALLEAQAAGLPALIGDRPGPRSLVAPGESAALVPEGDAAAFATALGGLLHDSWKRAEMGVAAQANCAAHHDLGPAAARLHALLGGLGVAPSEVSPPSAVSK
jgi:glycosyltransferase involved in cell wall biosynthesis